PRASDFAFDIVAQRVRNPHEIEIVGRRGVPNRINPPHECALERIEHLLRLGTPGADFAKGGPGEVMIDGKVVLARAERAKRHQTRDREADQSEPGELDGRSYFRHWSLQPALANSR